MARPVERLACLLGGGDAMRPPRTRRRAAARLCEESLALIRKQDVKGGIPSLLHNLGHVALATGDVARAEQLFRESLRRFREQGDQRGVAHSLTGLAGVLGAMQRPAPAARLFGAAEALLGSGGGGVGRSNQADYERNLALVRVQIDPCTLNAAWAEGRALTLDEAVAYADEPTAR